MLAERKRARERTRSGRVLPSSAPVRLNLSIESGLQLRLLYHRISHPIIPVFSFSASSSPAPASTHLLIHPPPTLLHSPDYLKKISRMPVRHSKARFFFRRKLVSFRSNIFCLLIAFIETLLITSPQKFSHLSLLVFPF